MTWKTAIVPALALALAGTLPHLAAAADSAITARGNEPFWSLSLDDKEIQLRTNMGADAVTFATPKPEVSRRYVVQPEGVTVTVTDRVCTDTMSGMPFPLTVTVEKSDGTLSGCGGESASLLTGDEWTVTSINGTATIGSQPVTITFADDGTAYGNASCNRFTGGWVLTGEGLTLGPMASTMMACTEDGLSNQEHAFLTALETVGRFEIGADGSLVLMGGDGPGIVATR